MSQADQQSASKRDIQEPPLPAPWHAQDPGEVSARLVTDLNEGLSTPHAVARLEQYGPNTLPGQGTTPLLVLFAQQFKSLVVVLLITAATVSWAVGDIVEGGAVAIVVVFNGLIGFFTQWKARSTLDALRDLQVPVARVIRDGQEQSLPASTLVPGDLVVLTEGDKVPADGRIVASNRLTIEEATLTGESVPSSKQSTVQLALRTPLGDRCNMAYLGTIVLQGRGQMLITETASFTEMGRIGALMKSAEDRPTPLQLQLDQLGKLLVLVVLGICSLVALGGWLRGYDALYVLEVAIALAIAAVPEGLPAVATMTLAIGMQRMAKRGAVLKRLDAVETLGATTVICTDKTGTLTRNEMTVTTLVSHAGQWSFTAQGDQARLDGGEHSLPFAEAAHHPELNKALQVALLCNDAAVYESHGQLLASGDPTEGALLLWAERSKIGPQAARATLPRVAEIPFSSDYKYMATVHKTACNQRLVCVKGSPGTLLALCGWQFTASGIALLGHRERARWEQTNVHLAQTGLRVLGLAYTERAANLVATEERPGPIEGLIFVGLVGMTDPLRDEAKPAIQTCSDAGIRILMMTGDQQPTAARIATQLGMVSAEDAGARTIHAKDLDELDPEGWRSVLGRASVFARVSALHKLRIVENLQTQGAIVAVTGDGINDAPALKRADIGVAMGQKGCELAKEAADMVITDDNFATIVGAVEQGRIVYANISRFVHYLFSCNLAEILLVSATLALGWPLPLLALQLLWLNMFTDIFPALALALEPAAPGVMRLKPRNPAEPLVTPAFAWLIIWQAVVLASAALVAFGSALALYGADAEGLSHAMTIAFTTLALVQIVHTFNARSRTRSAFGLSSINLWLWSAVIGCTLMQIAAVYVPALQQFLRTVALNMQDWLLIAVCAGYPIAVIETVKLAQHHRRTR